MKKIILSYLLLLIIIYPTVNESNTASDAEVGIPHSIVIEDSL